MSQTNQTKRYSLSRLAAIVGAIILMAVTYLFYVGWASMPMVRGYLEQPYLHEDVEVIRNDVGVPRIVGHRNKDVYYAQGYVHAQDRLFQMTMLKYMFLGRMSELVGKKTVKLDEYMRLFNIEQSAKASYAQFGPSHKVALEAYAAGVNAYIEEHHETLEQRLLGFKLEKWRPQDSVVIQKAIAFDLSRHWPRIIRNTALASIHGNARLDEFFPEEVVVEPSVLDSDLKRHRLPYDDEPKFYPDGPEIPAAVVQSMTRYAELNDAVLTGMSSDETLAPGSNAWVISPKRTKSGSAIVASDPHLSYNVPNTFYLIHMKSDTLELTGASIPGAPGIIIGRNANISWGFTNSRLAQSDIFYAKDIEGKTERIETIKVLGGKDVTVTYYDTDYGTLISDPGSEYDVALNWTGMVSVDMTLDALHNIGNASSLKEAKKSFKYFHTPAQNMVMSDNKGNYGLYVLGNVPIRQHSGRVAVPATEAYRWKKPIPYWEMPYVENPPRGYVMNANNYVVSPHYGYNVSKLGFDDLRAIRLAKMLKEDKAYTAEDNKRIQLDNEDQQWFVMKDTLMMVEPRSDLAKGAIQALDQWDGVADRTSYEVTIFSAWQREIASKIYLDIMQTLPSWAKPVHDDFFVINTIKNNTKACQINGGDCKDFLSDTLEAALAQLSARYGTKDIEQWQWKGSHKAQFKHGIFKKVPLLKQLSARQAEVDGTRDSLNRSRWFAGRQGFMGTQGACLRMVVDLESQQGHFIIPMGESGNVLSKHYSDLLPIWADGDYLLMPRTQSKGYESKLVLGHGKEEAN
ncbi:penicillin acylase family protein [Candidatus Synchoanobacter obligatus]|uniref:Penicillin acylase family protein n=1 Tax=Candidatus Synchoanobacter obligatus TaxID=2919597 RepID=A0ABT1L500_9GAMM|nr:penicillin acylase family protein [Candidatus Synchoanobacter obligatus]MCP8351991.1 penicillin acylase family protein [Candidatus Synchoanobacter obligatus]